MKSTLQILHWSPRILCILAILFISLFAMDAFEPGKSVWQQLGDFFMHLIPSFILLGFLLLAWKKELIGGILFLILGIVASPFVFMLNYNRNHFSIQECINVLLLITFPFMVVGVLFVLSYYKKKIPVKE